MFIVVRTLNSSARLTSRKAGLVSVYTQTASTGDLRRTLSSSTTTPTTAPTGEELAIGYFEQFSSYKEMVEDAKRRARRSILIDNCNLDSIHVREELWDSIEHLYRIKKTSTRGTSKLSLVELKSEACANELVRDATHNEGHIPIPMKVLRYYNRHGSPVKSQNLPFPVTDVTLKFNRESSPHIDSISALISNNMMTLTGLKLRFITLVNIEDAVCSGPFREYELLPFGSSVIHTGYDSGDLDLVFSRKARRRQTKSNHNELVHLDKSISLDYKSNIGNRDAMDYLTLLMRDFLPIAESSSVIPIYRARVPIIKFTSRVTDIDCDMSFNLGLDASKTTHGGIMMTEIFYTLCKQNNLVTAVMIFLKVFAKLAGITSKGSSSVMSNFQFQSLVLYFLQVEKLVPPLKDVYRTETQRVKLDDEELCQKLPRLVERFSRFYTSFDFANTAMNLNDARTERKLDNSPLYIKYPFEANKNICKTVHRKGLEHFRRNIRLLRDDPSELMKTLLISENAKNIRSLERSKVMNLDSPFISQETIAKEVCS